MYVHSAHFHAILKLLLGYFRLSKIAKDFKKFDESAVWLSRICSNDDDLVDIMIAKGDLFLQLSVWDDAKRCYEKSIKTVRYFINVSFIYQLVLELQRSSRDAIIR